MTTTQALTNDALARVEAHAREDWKKLAQDIVAFVATRHPEFTADDVLEALDHFPGVTTHTNRALGPVFLRAERDGLIRNTDRVVKSRLPRRHGRKITVWESLVYRPPVSQGELF